MTRFFATLALTVAVNTLDLTADALTWVANHLDGIEV